MKTIVNKVCMLLASAFLSTSWMSAQTDRGIRIEHLGTNNTFVRVTGQSKYLLLPVQDAGEESQVHVVVDGKLERSIVVRLATSKVDYTVPLDLTPYQGKHVVLNVVTPQSRSTIREAKEDACWKDMRLSDTFSAENREKYRPAYHHTPLYGWMNDPNGMVYHDGVWHLCYQWNPFGSKWQNMTWGHSTSRDLIHWEPQEPTLLPDGLGTIFSGSSAIDEANSAGFGKNSIVTLFTSAANSQVQSLAYSNDGGYTYTTYPGNPVLTLESEARDPNMFWNEETKQWTLILAHALDHEMLIFTSPDLKSWTLQSSFGKGLGAQDGVWECPDLFELPVTGTQEKKWVLICNINPGGPFGGSATQYFTGSFDGKTFKVDTDASGNVPTKWLDYGKDHYATVSWSDTPGRRTVIGWMSNWQYAAEVPTLQFRSANTLPREMGVFKVDDQYYVSSKPSPELDALRGKITHNAKRIQVGKRAHTVSLPQENDGICEILMNVDAKRSKQLKMTLANKAQEKVTIIYDVEKETISFDRTQSGIVDFSQDFPAVTVTPTYENDGSVNLRLFIDRSSMELFEQEGRFVMTNLVFPTSPYTTLSFQAEEGSAKVNNLQIYSIKVD
ncbi:MAG: DUF4980 domain-containing protein [Parabacteroides sp.]|nr:DUF4980 domain-containing protein [Parabacteroides sp.]